MPGPWQGVACQQRTGGLTFSCADALDAVGGGRMTKAKNRVEFANSLRGIASLSVLISHYFGLFWLARDTASVVGDFPAIAESTIQTPSIVHLLWTIPSFNWGGFGVALFFLVSGFVIPFSLRKYDAIPFLAARAMRILPTYAAGFSITIMALWLSALVYDRAFPFSLGEVAGHYVAGLRDLIGSPNIDYVVWTLEIEAKFYVACALIARFIKAGSLVTFAVPAAIFFVLLTSNGHSVSFGVPAIDRAGGSLLISGRYLMFMFIGVALHFRYRGTLSAEAAMAIAAALFGAFLIQWYSGPEAASFYSAWSWGAAVALFLAASALPSAWTGNSVFNFFADISYPLYVSHGVAGYVGLRILLGLGVPSWLALIAVTAAAIGVAYVLHVLIEMPTQRAAARIADHLSDGRLVRLSIAPDARG